MRWRRQQYGDFSDEVDTHIEHEIDRLIAEGVPPGEARARALRNFGSRAAVKERFYESSRHVWLDSLQRDFRQALRSVRKRPGFALVAMFALALGIGATTSVFSVADALFTRPLPVRNPEALVLFRTVGSPAWSDSEALVPFALYEHVGSGTQAFSGALVSEYQQILRRMVVRDETPGSSRREVIQGGIVSGNYFEVLGVGAHLGRVFNAADDVLGHQPLAVLSHRLWRNRYGEDPDIIGTLVHLEPASGTGIFPEGLDATIVGVAPRGFYGIDADFDADIWLTLVPVREAAPYLYVSGTNIGINRVMARLNDGVTLNEAQAEIDVINETIFDSLSGIYSAVAASGAGIRVERAASGYSNRRSELADPVLFLGGAAGLVLLIAAANVAGLLLIRGMSRRREIGIRMSLGCGRLGIVRESLAEAAVLAAGGGIMALGIVFWSTELLEAFPPPEAGFVSRIGIEGRTLAFSVAVSALTVILVAILPALSVSRPNLSTTLKGVGIPNGLQTLPARRTWQNGIVVLQVALTVGLLVSAGLLLRTVGNLRQVETGFDQENVIQFVLEDLSGNNSSLSESEWQRLEALPGVESITAYWHWGLLDGASNPENVAAVGSTESVAVQNLAVGPRFFETLGIDFISGGSFVGEGGIPSNEAIVSESLARRLFGDRIAVGRSLNYGSDLQYEARIVGVAEDTKHASLRDTSPYALYQPLGGRANLTLSNFAIRTDGGNAGLEPAIRTVVQEMDPNLRVRDVQTFREIREVSIARERLVARLASVFAAIALALASVGVYGVLAYSATERTAEIGIRMALGARGADVVRLMLHNTVWILGTGIGLGLICSLATSRVASGLLFGVGSLDARSSVVAVLVLVLASALAVYRPVRHAVSVSPTVALRNE